MQMWSLMEQVGRGLQTHQHARRPRWWHGNLAKAFYWACVGQPDTLGRKVDEARQKLTAIQAKEFRNTGSELHQLHSPQRHHHSAKPSQAQHGVCTNVACVYTAMVRLDFHAFSHAWRAVTAHGQIRLELGNCMAV